MDRKELFSRANAMAAKPVRFRNAAANAANKIDLLGELRRAGLRDDGLVGE